METSTSIRNWPSGKSSFNPNASEAGPATDPENRAGIRGLGPWFKTVAKTRKLLAK